MWQSLDLPGATPTIVSFPIVPLGKSACFGIFRHRVSNGIGVRLHSRVHPDEEKPRARVNIILFDHLDRRISWTV